LGFKLAVERHSLLIGVFLIVDIGFIKFGLNGEGLLRTPERSRVGTCDLGVNVVSRCSVETDPRDWLSDLMVLLACL
jgi:hypothetical protein